MGKHAPKAPDPNAVAATQAGFNKKAAQTQLNMNAHAGNQSGPFGSSNYTFDPKGNVSGLDTSLDPSLQGGASNVMGNFGAQTGFLPTQPINWDTTTPQNIFNSGMNAYQQFNEPLRAQEDNRFMVNMADRGIPIGGEIWNNEQGNMDRSRSVGDAQAAASLWSSLPGMQGQMINNQITQNNQPFGTASLGLGLLGGLKGLTPQAAQLQAGVSAPSYQDAAYNSFNAKQGQYNTQMSGLGQLASTGLGLLAAPYTGGASLGAAAAANGGGFGSWSPSVFYS